MGRKDVGLRYPIEHGIITNFYGLETIIDHAFNNVVSTEDLQEQKVMLTEKCSITNVNRERPTQIMFETFNVKGFFISVGATLGLYANGRTTGVSLDSGEGISYSMPVYEGYALPHAIVRSHLGGITVDSEIETYLKSFPKLKNSSQELTSSIVTEIKENYCTLVEDLKTKSLKETLKLPDGEVLVLNEEIIRAPETLFNPKSSNEIGLAQSIHNSIMKSDVDIRRDLYPNVVLCGGNTCFRGFRNRIEKDLKHIQTIKASIKTFSQENRKFSIWNGGSLLSSLSTFQQMWITNTEYEESGPAIVHRKCY